MSLNYKVFDGYQGFWYSMIFFWALTTSLKDQW